MKKKVLCECGSGKSTDSCCVTNVRVWKQPLNQNDQKAFLQKIKISSEFGMRYRGLLEFYGNDLISYKLESPKNKARNQFLEILAKYFTEYLEDDCPTSWEECTPSFWEELLFTFYPFLIKVTPDQKEVENFVAELKKFVRWIYGNDMYTTCECIDKYLEESISDLKECEYLINHLYLHTFPRIHHDDWDPQLDIFSKFQQEEKYKETLMNIFEVKNLNGKIVVVTALDSGLSYYIRGLPHELITPSTILSGVIGRKSGDWFWTWNLPESVFPHRSKKYLENVSLI